MIYGMTCCNEGGQIITYVSDQLPCTLFPLTKHLRHSTKARNNCLLSTYTFAHHWISREHVGIGGGEAGEGGGEGR